MEPSTVLDSIHESLNAFLEKASVDQVRLIDYALKGVADGSIRDLTWVLGRKAGRVYIAQS